MMYAAIRLRGRVNIDPKVKNILDSLKLTRVNHCVILPKNKTSEGALKKCRNYITWGEISEELLKKLVEKRGRKEGGKRLNEKEADIAVKSIIKDKSTKNAKIKHVFRLSPASKGLKSVLLAYPKGDLGSRKKIDDLLKRMI